MSTDKGAVRLGALLRDAGWTVAVAESLTAGRLQASIGAVSGASAYFLGGMTTYTIDQKVNLLGVDREHAASVDCVSPKVAREMVMGVRKRFGADVSAATTGYAEPPKPGRDPMAHIAIDVRGQVYLRTIQHPGRDRIQAQQATADAAIALLIWGLEQPR
ncbi:MAG: CinA family protein [Myxococcota bacterium]